MMNNNNRDVLIKIAEALKDTSAIETAVGNWLEDHPEATTTVQDGSITKAKLDANLQSTVDDVTDLQSLIDSVMKLDNPIDLPFETDGTSHYILWNTGAVSSELSAYFDYTDYIDISKYDEISYKRTKHTISNPAVGIAFYDSSKQFIKGYRGLSNQDAIGYGSDLCTVSVPQNAVYVRCSIYSDTSTYGTFNIKGYSQFISSVSDIIDSVVFSRNLFDKTTITSGKYIATNTGDIVDYAGTFVSDYIPVIPGKTYSYHVASTLYGTTAAARLFLFDKDKNKIDYGTGTLSNKVVTITIPLLTGAKYCRFSDYLNIVDSVMFVEGTYPETYIPYGINKLDESFGLNNRQIEEAQAAISSGVLYGKKIAYNGDSIAESRLQDTNAYNGGAYAKMIADLTGGTYENRAVSGGILASAPGDSGSTPSRCVVSDVTNMTDDADLICFEGGINDYWRDVPLGDYSESDYSSTLDTTTVCGALESIFRQATAKWVGKPIVFVIVHKIKSTVYVANSVGYTFAQAREKMIGICKKYAISYYDAFAESGLNAYNDIQNTTFLTSNSEGTPDGCHPNEAAYKRYYVPQLIALFESMMPMLSES